MPAVCGRCCRLILIARQYYMYNEDVARIKYLGLNAYSFSISWTRILPLGTGTLSIATCLITSAESSFRIPKRGRDELL